jgi:hypothetical protein
VNNQNLPSSIRIQLLKTNKYKNPENKCWQGCGEVGNLCIAGGSIKWCTHYGKIMAFLKKLNTVTI